MESTCAVLRAVRARCVCGPQTVCDQAQCQFHRCGLPQTVAQTMASHGARSRPSTTAQLALRANRGRRGLRLARLFQSQFLHSPHAMCRPAKTPRPRHRHQPPAAQRQPLCAKTCRAPAAKCLRHPPFRVRHRWHRGAPCCTRHPTRFARCDGWPRP